MSAREIGIPWSGPMVLALLARRKTVTRRMIKLSPTPWRRHDLEGGCMISDWKPQPCDDGTWELASGFAASEPEDTLGRPRYRVGDHIWGREAWCAAIDYDRKPPRLIPPEASIVWRADYGYRGSTIERGKWRPPMFMPRWASRLLHRVLDVRAERLLDITEEDALAEGIEEVARGFRWPSGDTFFTTARACYLRGYDSLHPDAPSKLNPWVWRIAFEPVE